MAEIPTYQAGRIDARGYARRIAANARLEVDGRRAAWYPYARLSRTRAERPDCERPASK